MIHARHTERLKRQLNEIYVKHTDQSLENVEEALERDNFMTPPEAKEWGLIDQVFDKRPDQADDKGTHAGDVTPS